MFTFFVNSGFYLFQLKNITLPSKQNLIDLLVNMHFAVYVPECNDENKESDDDEELLEPDPQDFLSICNKNKHKSVTNSTKLEPDNSSDYSSNATPIVPETQTPPVIDWFDIVDASSQVILMYHL